jgi:hypothetical protein
MTLPSPSAEIHRPTWPAPGLVLVGAGGVRPVEGAPLAALLGLRSLAWSAERLLDAPAALADLSREAPGWLLPLGLDPGAELPQPGCWCEALGAWRQAVLLQIPAAAAGSGVARAYAALLQAAGVPLVGLVQRGAPWDPDRRRVDGLPWLGWLPEEPTADSADAASEAVEALRLHLLARWQLSSARGAEPAHLGL